MDQMRRCKTEEEDIGGDGWMDGLESCSACCLAEMNSLVSTEAIRRTLPVLSAPWGHKEEAYLSYLHLRRCSATTYSRHVPIFLSGCVALDNPYGAVQ